MEKKVKLQSHQSRLADMKACLKAAQKEVNKARSLAMKTAYCCDTSLENLEGELATQISIIGEHLKVGLLENDVVRKAK